MGELRLGRRRAARAEAIHTPYQEWLNELCQRMHVDWEQRGEIARPLSQLIERTVGIPACPVIACVCCLTGRPLFAN